MAIRNNNKQNADLYVELTPQGIKQPTDYAFNNQQSALQNITFTSKSTGNESEDLTRWITFVSPYDGAGME
jgi:hypothetical protein